MPLTRIRIQHDHVQECPGHLLLVNNEEHPHTGHLILRHVRSVVCVVNHVLLTKLGSSDASLVLVINSKEEGHDWL